MSEGGSDVNNTLLQRGLRGCRGGGGFPSYAPLGGYTGVQSLDCWRRLRERQLWRLYADLEAGRVDPWVLPLLSLLWSLGYTTTSSCAGRITVKCGPSPWAKGPGGAKILYSSHEPVDPKSLAERLSKLECSGYMWLEAEPPFVTLYAPGVEEAEFIVSVAVDSGFKYSGYRGSDCGYYVLVRGEERMSILVAIGGKLLMPDTLLEEAAKLASSLLERGRTRLEKLLKRLEELAGGRVG